MKKMMMTLMATLMLTLQASAMSFEQARNEALFLTDKMAYELNLTDEQYEAAYEINLDYLMGVTSRSDVFGTYWERRNLDLSYILLDWQWNAFLAASYFYRPLYWDGGYWHFRIYTRYPHRDYFYFGRPHFYATYRGGHAWHIHGTHGYYYGHRDHFRTPSGRAHVGMHDRWNRGDFRGHQRSSTRITGRDGYRSSIGSGRGTEHNRSIGSGRSMENNRTIGSNRLSNRQVEGHSSYRSSGSRTGYSSSNSSRSNFSGGSSNRSSFSGSSSNRSSFSGSSSRSSAPSRSFSGSTSSPSRSSFSGSSSRSSSFSGGSHVGSHGGGHSGGSHAGGRR